MSFAKLLSSRTKQKNSSYMKNVAKRALGCFFFTKIWVPSFSLSSFPLLFYGLVRVNS